METLRGIAVSPGVAIGPTLVLDRQGYRIHSRRTHPNEVTEEIARLDRCLSEISDEIRQNAKMVSERLGPEVALIFEAHRRMIIDPHLRELIVHRIEKESASAEFAVRRVLGSYADFFRNQPSGHFSDRVSDIQDIEQQILAHLLGKNRVGVGPLPHEVIILAHDLTPSLTASFDRDKVIGMATQTGGRTSHTAIVAGAMEIPAVVGLGDFPREIPDGTTIILDGVRGLLILDPDEATLERYRSSVQDQHRFEQSLEPLRDLPARTIDGTRVSLMGNIEFPHEAEHCLERGAEGIGLYRTEFLYLNRTDPPSEDEQYEAYAAVLKTMGPDRPVVLRTMDLGADKLHPNMPNRENNPFLGLRSIRLSLRNLKTLKTQLRAMLRASVYGQLRIMFPLVSTVMEMRRCRLILEDVMEDLDDEKIEYSRDIPIGMMVEVPSAALLADQFARLVDFFSIGTNDLIQYTLAVDRTNETVAPLYSASDPAVLTLVRSVIKAAERRGIGVSICGEMSGDPIYTTLLVGMGLRSFSVTPHNIPEIKKIIRSITVEKARKVFSRVKRLDTAASITNFLRNRTRRIVPELIDDLS